MTLRPYPFQEDAINQLLEGKHIIKADCGLGKTCIFFNWLERNHATHVIIATTASKCHSKDFQTTELIKFTSPEFRAHLVSLEVVSWHMLKKWTDKKSPQQLANYYFVADELQRCRQGVSSLMGRAFLFITKHCKAWTGYTGTPGDNWLQFHPYFIATGKIKNKTEFMRDYTISQQYPFPMVLGFRHEDTLKGWWRDISYEPDTSEVMSQLPAETHQIMRFPTPKGYKKVLKSSTTLDGEFLDSNMALYHHLRQMCATKQKLDALEDLLSSLSSPLVIFFNYTCEREQILGLAAHMKRKVWRIDGECHEIPTEETIGQNDIVLCHYLSGSEALNLQFCHYMVFYSPNYSYSISVQAKGRVKRVGQQNPMFFYSFLCSDSIEEEVMDCIKQKKDFAEKIWSPSVKRN